MSLYLLEFVPTRSDRDGVTALLAEIDKTTSNVGAGLIEAQVTGDHGLVLAVVEAEDREALRAPFAEISAAARVTGPDEVRLVGADLAELKAARPTAGYLVEWDLPAHLTMETYLARKKEKAPRYADVPEVSFLRTYVREDMAKCLCFYDADSDEIVRRGRAAVDTPIDRLHALEQR